VRKYVKVIAIQDALQFTIISIMAEFAPGFSTHSTKKQLVCFQDPECYSKAIFADVLSLFKVLIKLLDKIISNIPLNICSINVIDIFLG
jgi:hypothetical protein